MKPDWTQSLLVQWWGYRAAFYLVKKDVHYMLAQYIMDKEIKQHMHWARLTLHTIKCAIHQIQVTHCIPSNPDHALLPKYWKSLPTKLISNDVVPLHHELSAIWLLLPLQRHLPLNQRSPRLQSMVITISTLVRWSMMSVFWTMFVKLLLSTKRMETPIGPMP
jgi:hypothetical protein